MNNVMEWVFTADVHPAQVFVLIVAMYLGKAFLEFCYGKTSK